VTTEYTAPAKKPRLIVQNGILTPYGKTLFLPKETSGTPGIWTNDVRSIKSTKK